jgi:hypothetical protein
MAEKTELATSLQALAEALATLKYALVETQAFNEPMMDQLVLRWFDGVLPDAPRWQGKE